MPAHIGWRAAGGPRPLQRTGEMEPGVIYAPVRPGSVQVEELRRINNIIFPIRYQARNLLELSGKKSA